MKFSLCSCSHFLWKGKHSVMSKREQDRTSKEGPAVAKPKQMSLVARCLLSSTRDPPQSWSASNDRGSRRWMRVPPQRASGNRCEVVTQTRNPDPKSGMTTRPNLQASGNRCEVTMPKFKYQSWSSIVCKSPIGDTWKKSSGTCDRSCISLKIMIGIEANNLLIWGLFMASTMKAAVHLGPNYTENMEVCKNANFKEIFNVTQKLIMDHPMEILIVSTVDWTSFSWQRSTLHT